jgi:hypothetical protein
LDIVVVGLNIIHFLQTHLHFPNIHLLHTHIFHSFTYISIPAHKLTRNPVVFYSPIFSSLEQKNVSGHLTALWSRDPFKAKWTIATRAYSSIRDLVGKPLAPVDKFLAIVCPELGIIDPSLYLEMMCWEIEYDLNGQIVGLLQTAVPDVAAFDDYIKYTGMNENDVVHFCAYMGYISQHAANIIAGDPAQQQTLLATAPAAIAPAPAPVIAAPIINPFLADTVNDPRAAATQVLGFDVDEVLGPAEQSETPGAGGLLLSPAAAPAPNPYEWTGCMADLYNPDEGTFNFEDMVRDQCDGDVGDISDPASFDEMFGDVLEGGFMQPSVSEEYGDAGDFF